MRTRWLPLAVLATAQFLVVLSTSIVNVSLPQIRSGLGTSATGLSWVVNAYVLAFGALLLPGGRFGDAYGLRRVFLVGAGIFAASAAAAAIAPDIAALIAARSVQGLGAALMAPTALALVLTLYRDSRDSGVALGVWGAVSGAGGAAGVLLGGLLTDRFGWRSVFFLVVPVALAVLLTTWRLVEPRPAVGGRPDVPSVLTATVGLVTLTYGLSGHWTALAAGLFLLVAFAFRQRRVADPLLPPRMAPVAWPNVAMALLGAVWLGLFYYLPLYQQHTLGYTPLRAGLTQLPLALMITVSSWVAGRLPGRATLPVGLLMLATGLAWLARTPSAASFLIDLLGPTLLIGAGMGVAFVRITASASAGVPAADSGLAGGLVNASRQLGGAAGLSFLTVLPTFGAVFLTCAAITVLTLITVTGKAISIWHNHPGPMSPGTTHRPPTSSPHSS
ncbi:MFS transporter [Nocardia sp. NPDC004604]|uniref:MFS transporter n=1 Tax=Nocardia sp. NPDC004604 TaxID=3157013 RepID=UPI0033B20AF4